MSDQSAFADRLLEPSLPPPRGLRVWNGRDPAHRFGIYRNNIVSSLIDALASSYPVVNALVGEEFFRAMAAEFVRSSPPRSAVLAWYGKHFAEFLASYPPVARLPYLPDMARFEWLFSESLHAAEALPVAASDWQALLEDEQLLSKARFVFHPAAQVFFSPHPIISLWNAHQAEDIDSQLKKIDMHAAESALLMRNDLSVEVYPVDHSTREFLTALQSGCHLIQSIPDGDFDLAGSLALIIRSTVVIHINPS